MTVRLIVAVIACTFGAPLLVSQASFEGKLRLRTIELSVEEDGRQEQLLDVPAATLARREDAQVTEGAMMIKGSVIRMEGGEQAEGGYGLWDIGRHTITMIQPSQRMYMELPLDQAPAGTPAPARPGAPVVKPLGQPRTINGMRTTGYEVRGADFVIRGWMTQDHPGLTGAFRRAVAERDETKDEEDLAMEQLLRHGFPVLMFTLNRGSLRIEETVSVERTTLGADLFQIPAGYTKMTIPTIPR